MKPWQIVLLIVILVLIALLVFVYFFGRKMQKRQVESEAQLKAMEQVVSALIIDKKILPIKEAGLPKEALDQTPWYLRRSKLPIVKVKIGPKFANLIAEKAVYDILPVKKECKIVLSGIYISELKSVRGGNVPVPPKKLTFRQKIAAKFSKKDKGEKK